MDYLCAATGRRDKAGQLVVSHVESGLPIILLGEKSKDRMNHIQRGDLIGCSNLRPADTVFFSRNYFQVQGNPSPNLRKQGYISKIFFNDPQNEVLVVGMWNDSKFFEPLHDLHVDQKGNIAWMTYAYSVLNRGESINNVFNAEHAGNSIRGDFGPAFRALNLDRSNFQRLAFENFINLVCNSDRYRIPNKA